MLSCKAAFATEPAVPLTAGSQVSMVAPTVARSKVRPARPCQLQHLVGQPPGRAFMLVLGRVYALGHDQVLGRRDEVDNSTRQESHSGLRRGVKKLLDVGPDYEA